MKFPTKYTHYGYGWLEKIKQGYHPGIDYNNGPSFEDEGQDVIAITDGTVIHVKFCKGWGNHVILNHPKYNIYSHYAHLQAICVKEGDQIKEGQLIGPLGSTGGNWPPHLHFEIRLKDFSPDKYVTGMTIDEIQSYYADPEKWIKGVIDKEQKIQNSPTSFIKENNYMKLIKNSSSNKVYAICNDRKKHWILNEETFNVGHEMGLWGGSEEIQILNDDSYEEGHTLVFVKYL